jgi:hypothetical protein
MLDQSLLQSHFIGRDGFRWWIGQIPPLSTMGKQVEGGGWGNRFKVRILGYHPYSEAELPNEDLPWAQCLIPTTAGSGAANVATGVQLQQGDVVLGFFLDGDNAQIPVILATFGRSDSVPSTSYKSPFEAFTGFSELMQKNIKQTPSENNQPTENSLRSPISASDEIAQKVSQKVGEKVVSENSAICKKVHLANTVKNTQLDKIKAKVDNLMKDLKKFQGDLQRIQQAIDKATDDIVKYCNEFIGSSIDFIINGDKDKGGKFPGLKGLLKEGLKLLYQSVYSQVLAATGNPVAAHLAGVAAQEAMLIPVKVLEGSFGCIAGAAIDQLKSLVSDILQSTLDNVDRFTSCATEQFAGSVLNSVIGVLENLFNGPLEGIATLLKFFEDFNLGNLLREGIGMFSESGIGFGCNQDASAFKSLVNEWGVGCGPSGSLSTLANSMVNSYQSVKNITNIISSGVDIASVKECFTDAIENALPPVINIFGGRGSGCTAIPIFGNLVTQLNGNVTASIIGIQITNSGSGYEYPPFIEITDEIEQGYGAVARSVINEKGEVTGIYMVSEGENYSVGDIEEYSVVNVLVENGGSGYKDVKVTDNLGNDYDAQLDNGRIYKITPLNNVVDSLPVLTVSSNTGTGAILRPLLGAPKFSGELQTVVDCVT